MADEKQPIEKQPITVWHVDDNESIQRTVARGLKNGGYSVLTTGSFEEAKSMIPDGIRNVRVAILDNNLGDDDGDGEQIAKLLKDNQIPIGIIGLATGKTPWADISFYKLDGSGDEQIAKWLTAVAKLAAGK